MALTYEPIATTTLGADAANVTFSSIPSTYTDLRLIFRPITPATRDVRIRFNGDTGTNYSRTDIYGDNNAVAGTQNVTNANHWRINATSGATPNLSFYAVDLFSYANSKYKTGLAASNESTDTSPAYILYSVGLWRSTSAINQIVIFPDTGNWLTGTMATLYGIKAA